MKEKMVIEDKILNLLDCLNADGKENNSVKNAIMELTALNKENKSSKNVFSALSKRSRKRLSEYRDEEEQKALIFKLSDENFSKKIIESYNSELVEIRNQIDDVLKNNKDKNPFFRLNQILKCCLAHNWILENIKGLDEDIFISNIIIDSQLGYSEAFADTIIRMRSYEEDQKNVYVNDTSEPVNSFEDEKKAIDEILREDEDRQFTINNDFEEEILTDCTFQKCVSKQRRYFKLEPPSFDLISNYFNPELKRYCVLDTHGHTEAIFYQKEIYQLYELNARLFSRQFIDENIIKKLNVFVDVQSAVKNCFVPLFESTFKLQKKLIEQGIYTYNLEDENSASLINTLWETLYDLIKSSGKDKTKGWENFVIAVDSGSIIKMEEAWDFFVQSEQPDKIIIRAYYQLVLAYLKKLTPLPVFPLKNIPVSPFEFVYLTEIVEKYEFMHLRSLLKWVLRCSLIDFQTFVSMPLLKAVLKEMHKIIRLQVNLTLRKMFLIHQQVVKLSDFDRSLYIEDIKKHSQVLLNNEWEKDVNQSDETGTPWLIKSILANDYSSFCKMLKIGANINDINLQGETALILLARLERYDWINELLKYNPNLNSFDFYGRTCAHYLAQHNAHLILKKITKLGAKLNCIDINECTPLYIASKLGCYETVQFLLGEDVHINQVSIFNKTALDTAVEQGHEKVALLLIKAGANIYTRDKNLKTCLHYAAMSGSSKVADVLIKRGIEVDSCDAFFRTPLHISCLYGHKNVAKILLEKNADVDAKDANGQTPLHLATSAGITDCMDILMQYGANVDKKDNFGQSAVYLAALNKQKKSFKELVCLGSKIYTKANDSSSALTLVQDSTDRSLKSSLKQYENSDLFFDSALFLGIMKENLALVEKAINFGAHLKALTLGEKSALEWAIEVGNMDILKALYQNGCPKPKIIKKNIGHSSLLSAIIKNDISSVRLLIKAGADVNSKDGGTDYSVLHYASAIGNTTVIELLIQNGANINICDLKGRTPLYIARQTHQLDAESVLLSLGAVDDIRSKPVSYFV